MPPLEDPAETQALLQFWEKDLGGIGTLVTEYPVAGRRIDGVVIPGDKPDGKRIKRRRVPLEEKDVIAPEQGVARRRQAASRDVTPGLREAQLPGPPKPC